MFFFKLIFIINLKLTHFTLYAISQISIRELLFFYFIVEQSARGLYVVEKCEFNTDYLVGGRQ